MNRIFKLFLANYFILSSSYSTVVTGWAAKTEGVGEENVTGLVTDDEGSLYVTQSFNHQKGTMLVSPKCSVEIAPVPEVIGYSNTLFTSFANNGDIRWALKIESEGSIKAWKLKYGKDGNLYICGNFNRDAIFNSTNGQKIIIDKQTLDKNEKYFYRFFIAKYNTNGVLQWVKCGHSADNTVGFDIVADSVGNSYTWLYSAGNNLVFDDVMLLKTGTYPKTIQSLHLIIAKLNSAGKLDWCLVGNEKVHINKLNIDEKNQLELISIASLENAYFINTNKWDTLLNEKSNVPITQKIIVDTNGMIKKCISLNVDVKFGNLRSYAEYSAGSCFVYTSAPHPITHSYNTRIVIDKDTLIGNGSDDLYVVFSDRRTKKINYTAIRGKGNEKFRDIITTKNGDVYVAVLVSPEATLTYKKSVLRLTNENQYSYYILHFDSSGKFCKAFFAGNYGYGGYEEHLHLSSFQNKVAMGVELGLKSIIMKKDFQVSGYKPESGNKINTTDALLLFADINEDTLLEVSFTNSRHIVLKDFYTKAKEEILAIKSKIIRNDTLVRHENPQTAAAYPKEEYVEKTVVKEKLETNTFLFPNPVSQTAATIKFRIKEYENEILFWQLQTLSGQILNNGEEKINDSVYEFPISLNGFSSGIYFLHIKVNSQVVSKKIIVF